MEGNERPTFQDFFDYCNSNFYNEVVILSNADIFFDETIRKLKEIDFGLHFVCLSRWEFESSENVYIRDDEVCSFSQDVWVFKTPTGINFANFSMGIPRCDGRIAFLSNTFGYKPINPCKTIKCLHRHSSEIRNYVCGTDFVDGDVLYVQPREV